MLFKYNSIIYIMYIIEDAWIHIKTFLFHNIKTQGKHLKTYRKDIKTYNEVVKTIPIIKCPITGPQIIHSSRKKSFKYVKLLYHGVQLKRTHNYPRYNTIIEIIGYDGFVPDYYTVFGKEVTTRKNLVVYYKKNIENVKSKLT